LRLDSNFLMYLRPALIVALYLFCVLKAQPGVDSLQIPNDTVYINQPPLIIKRQVIIHDTLPAVKERKKKTWFVSASGSLDNWIKSEEVMDTSLLLKKTGTSLGLHAGTEMGHWSMSVGLGIQRFEVQEQIEKIITHYHKDSIVRLDTLKYPNGDDICWEKERGGIWIKQCSTIVSRIPKMDTINEHSKTLLPKREVRYYTFPIRLGWKYEIRQWFITPEVWIIPMFITHSSTLKTKERLQFDKKLTAYKISINISREILKNLHLEIGVGYQGQLGSSPTLKLQFGNLHFGVKYYISKGTSLHSDVLHK
jgi:hypothetical protein